MRTLVPGELTVMSASPDPPFEVVTPTGISGFDFELMRAVCGRLSLTLKSVAYSGDDFNGIFAKLKQGRCDAVISGTTITPERAANVRFSKPYLEFNQGVAVNRRLTPKVASIADLEGLTAGIQEGNTSDIVARRLLAEGKIAGIHYYPYDGIADALNDLDAGKVGLVIKLHPVISWLTRDRPHLEVVFEVPTHEKLGIAYAPDRADLCEAIDGAIDALRASGDFARLVAAWPGLAAAPS
jgi:ABC-type amino acid transport substrate-binding protein